MIDIDLINKSFDSSSYIFKTDESYPLLFLGFNIKNEYDNTRIQLNKEYNPINLMHPSKDRKSVIGLKGIILTPKENIRALFKAIKIQETVSMNLVTYCNLLNQYNLACKETYSCFSPGTYPIDFHNLKSVCDDSFNTDKKIFQHLLNLDEKVFDFQKFSSLKLFVLTV